MNSIEIITRGFSFLFFIRLRMILNDNRSVEAINKHQTRSIRIKYDVKS